MSKKKFTIISLIILAVVWLFIVNTTALGQPPVVQQEAPLFEPFNDVQKSEITLAVNEYRESQGLKSVPADNYSCDYAKRRADQIAATNNFSHDGFREDMPDRLTDFFPGSGRTLVTENLARNIDYKEVVNAWIRSKGHRENLVADYDFFCIQGASTEVDSYFVMIGWKFEPKE